MRRTIFGDGRCRRLFVVMFLIVVAPVMSAAWAAEITPAIDSQVENQAPPEPQAADDGETTPPAEEADEGQAGTEEDSSTTTTSSNQDASAKDSDVPDYAKGSAKEKMHRLFDAVRGLATWNLFDDRVTVRAYARIQIDGTSANGNDAIRNAYGDLGESLDLRRFTLLAEGTIDHHLRYVFGYDFGVDISLSDAYIEGIDSGLTVFGYNLGKFRAGFFQEPFSLERGTSSYYIGFLERSLPVQTFTPGNNLGYMVHDTARNDRMTWAVGFFSFGTNNNQNEQNASNSTLSVTARLTGLPVWKEDGRHLVHVGLAYSVRTPQSSTTRYHSRPEARFVPYFADTGDIDSSGINLSGVEGAMVHGPLWMQAELVHSSVSSTEYGNLGFWGAYYQVGYFLTGEVRPYDRDNGVFGRVEPSVTYSGGVPFKKSRGGAFELTGRISNIDLDDKGLDGGQMLDFSFGFNWYPNDTSRIMLNYIRSRAEHGVEDVGKANIFLLRYQYRPRSR